MREKLILTLEQIQDIDTFGGIDMLQSVILSHDYSEVTCGDSVLICLSCETPFRRGCCDDDISMNTLKKRISNSLFKKRTEIRDNKIKKILK